MPAARPTLLLVHGLGCSARAWDRAVPELESWARIVAIDLPGFGSRNGEPAGDSIDAMAEALLPVAEELARTSEGPLIAVGHSMGGCVSAALALAGAPVDGVVLVDSPLTVEGRRTASSGNEGLIRRPIVGRLAWRLATRANLRRGLRSAFAPGYEVPSVFVDDLARCSWRSFTQATAAIDDWLAEAPLAERLAAVPVPAAYLLGPDDLRITADSLTAFRAATSAPIYEIAGAGHTPMWEQPQAFLRTLMTALVEHAFIAEPSKRQ